MATAIVALWDGNGLGNRRHQSSSLVANLSFKKCSTTALACERRVRGLETLAAHGGGYAVEASQLGASLLAVSSRRSLPRADALLVSNGNCESACTGMRMRAYTCVRIRTRTCICVCAYACACVWSVQFSCLSSVRPLSAPGPSPVPPKCAHVTMSRQRKPTSMRMPWTASVSATLCRPPSHS
jgi:hypothetical protein